MGNARKYSVKKLSEVGISVLDCDHKTPPATTFGYPYIAIPNLRDGRLELDEVRLISRENYELWTRRTKPQLGDIILTRRARVGDTAIVPEGLECALGQNLVILRSNEKHVSQKFLRWLLRSPEYWEQVYKFQNEGATFSSLNVSDIPKFEFSIPPLPTQRRIAEILGRLDDKIEVNRRINRTLEAMAQALFKHWFVDFGPFQEGEFVESELGLIPRGWRICRLKDVTKINSSTIQKGQEPDEIIYVDISSVSTGRIDGFTPMQFSEAPSRARRLVKHGDMIWSAVRPNRRAFCLIQHPEDNLVVSTGFAVIRPEKVPYSYIYATLSTQEFTDYLALRATGAAYPAVTTNDFEIAPILVPDREALLAFHKLMEPWLEQKYILDKEIHALTATRDYLLPKLLSGEVEV